VPPGQDTQETTITAAEDRVNAKLSQLLTRMGVPEQKAGQQQEDGAPDQALGAYDRALDHFQAAQEAQALGHYEEAEKDFSQSLALRPGDQETGKGQREAQEKVARLREKVSQEAEQNRGNQRSRSLQSLLGQVEERDRQLDPDRQRQRGRKDVSEKKNPLDW
jgi:tetratricopeptide (TPR) repeat protein